MAMLSGTNGNDALNGSDGADTIAGLAGADTLNGGAGDDTIYAGDVSPAWIYPGGNYPPYPTPLLDRGSEIDTINGGAGIDTIYAGYGDIVDGGGDEADLLISLAGASSGLTVDFHQLDNDGTMTIGGGLIQNIRSVLWIEGTNFDDAITGNDASGPIFGLAGNDHLVGGATTGSIYGGSGNDFIESTFGGGIYYGEDNDDVIQITNQSETSTAYGGDGNDSLTLIGFASGGPGNDELIAAASTKFGLTAGGDEGDDALAGANQDDMLAGGDGTDTISGGNGNDTLISDGSPYWHLSGADWHDWIDQGGLQDSLDGGDGNDLIYAGYNDNVDGGTGSDRLAITLFGAPGGVTLDVADLETPDPFVLGGGTIQNIERVSMLVGSFFNDVLTLSHGIPVYAMDGDDTIVGSAEADEIYGGYGNDTINGLGGDDQIHGGFGADIIDGGSGNDIIYLDNVGEAEPGEQINGGSEIDTLLVALPPDSPSGDVSLEGVTLTGVEVLTSWVTRLGVSAAQLTGVTTLNGLFYFESSGAISLAGKASPFRLELSLNQAGNQLDLGGFTAGDTVFVWGSDSDDSVIGSAGEDHVAAGGGNDGVEGGGGDDDLFGGLGDDSIGGGDGNDFITGDDSSGSYEGDGNDILSGGAGNDQLYGGGGNDIIFGGADDDYLVGGQGSDQLDGGDGRDWLIGLEADFSTPDANPEPDTLFGGNGDDQFIAGYGDSVNGGAGIFDYLDYSAIGAPVGITADFSVVTNGGSIVVGGAGISNIDFVNSIVGSNFNDAIVAGAAVGVLRMEGRAGDDSLTGSPAADSIDGGIGNDIIQGATGADLLRGGPGSDTFRGTAAGLNADTILDFTSLDKIVITDASLAGFTVSFSNHTLTFTGGSLTLANLPSGNIVASAAAGGGVQLTVLNQFPHNDFNGDGQSDILWQSSDGILRQWLGQPGGGFTGNIANVNFNTGPSWHVAGTGDFNGDGRADILWQNDDGTVRDWLGQPSGGFAGNTANLNVNTGAGWDVVGTGDFNGDGRTDVLWHHDDGTLRQWLGQANGGFTGNIANVNFNTGTAWQVAATSDFNGDGRDDILWHSDDGTVREWLGQPSGGFVGNIANVNVNTGTSWHVVGSGDFNGDGYSDLLWQNDEGTVREWLGQPSGGFVGNADHVNLNLTGWHIASIGDFNGDAIDDVFWHSDLGFVYQAFGATDGSGGFVIDFAGSINTGNSWHVQDPAVHDPFTAFV